MVVSLRDTIRKILRFQSDVAAKNNPTGVTAEQIRAYTVEDVDNEIKQYIGTGELPFNQFGDLGFSEPNISAKYEGATTYLWAIAYQTEADGSRNYLRNGTDGQTLGVYLCKYDVDANGVMRGYSPMATPWTPAWLPSGDRITHLLSSAANQVAVRCFGTYGGKYPANTEYFVVSRHNSTLDPNQHVDPLVVTFSMTIDTSFSTMFAVADSVYCVGAVNTGLDQPLYVRILRGIPPGGSGTSAMNPWAGTDALGKAYTGAPMPRMAERVFVEGNSDAYITRAEAIPGMGPFQTWPVYTVLIINGAEVMLHQAHEMWASRADGTDSRVFNSRRIAINVNTYTANVYDTDQGSSDISTIDGKFMWRGAQVKPGGTIGEANMGNTPNAWSQCPRTGEVLAQSVQTAYGAAIQNFQPRMTARQWLYPNERVLEGRQFYSYVPNLPSPVGSSIGHAFQGPGGLVINSTAGWTLLEDPDYANPVPYTYPDGTSTRWALDRGRKAVGAIISAMTMSVIYPTGATVMTGRCTRGGRGSTNVDVNGVRTGQWYLAANVETLIAARFNEVANPDGTAWASDFCYYVTPFDGSYYGGRAVLFVVGHVVGADKAGRAYLGVYSVMGDVTDADGARQINIVSMRVDRIGPVTTTGVTGTGLLTNYNTSTFQVAMPPDASYMWVGGAAPWNHSFVGNSGQPTMSVVVRDRAMTVIRDYEAHGYPNGSQLYWVPGLGPTQSLDGQDQRYSQTTMTSLYYGTDPDTMTTSKGQMLLATQAVYGSWNLYFSEEVYCQIRGIIGYLPKQTINLRDIKNDPANTKFYLYAAVNDSDTFSYLVTAAVEPSTQTQIFIGSITTDAIHISSVIINKVFSIDGFVLSHEQVARAIAASAGTAYDNGILNWPTIITS